MKLTRQDFACMKTAELWAELSYCTRNKVGAVIGLNGRIIATGYNGTPPGFDNSCEYECGSTKREVIHAEENAILFCAKHGLKTEGCDLYCTLSPCPTCCKMIATAGIKRVFYKSKYRDLQGLDILNKFEIETVLIEYE